MNFRKTPKLTVKDQWEELAASCLSPETSAKQTEFAKMCFYAGASATLQAVSFVLRRDGGDVKSLRKFIRRISDEAIEEIGG